MNIFSLSWLVLPFAASSESLDVWFLVIEEEEVEEEEEDITQDSTVKMKTMPCEVAINASVTVVKRWVKNGFCDCRSKTRSKKDRGRDVEIFLVDQ